MGETADNVITRRGARAARQAARAAPLASSLRPVRPGQVGGRYRPLSDSDVLKIHHAALDALETIGLADAPPTGTELPIADMPGPTGESNRLSLHTRAPVLCLGPGVEAARSQTNIVTQLGGRAVEAPGALPDGALTRLQGFSGAIWWGDAATGRRLTQSLAARNGPILPLITGMPDAAHVTLERHICIDTTAAGGNAALLAEAGNA